jgi:DNA-binding response OmpR family regulator
VRVVEPPAQESASRTVLMVDDDPDVRTSVARGLRHSGFNVRVAANGKEALRLLSNESHDALVLDVQMPELDGVAVVTALRALGNDIPICVLSARDTVNDRIAGLEAGADDYLTKPFNIEELRARIGAVLRRRATRREGPIRVGEMIVDPLRRKVTIGDRDVPLAKKEFTLLRVLTGDPTRVFSKAELLQQVWGYSSPGKTRTLDSHASRLRRKLDPEHSRYVINCWGIGYRLIDG